MSLLTTTAAGILSPETVGQLVVQPVQRESIALQVATAVQTSSTSFRIPLVTQDGVAAWTPEGTEITPTDASISELDCVPKKLAALSIISRELATDSSPAAQQVVGESLARDIARKLDVAFFANTTPNGPSGIASVAGVNAVTSDYSDTDGFSEAISEIETAGASATAFVTNPATALALAQLKKLSTGSNEPLLAADAASPSKRSVSGVPLWVSPAVAADVVWALDKSRSFVVLHGAVDLRVDESAYFSSDRIGIRVTLRAAFGFRAPAEHREDQHGVTTLRRTGFTPIARQQGARPPSDGSGTRAPHRQSRQPRPAVTAQATTVARQGAPGRATAG